LPFTPSFDKVLVDAPCSGLGTLRRDPDIKWQRVEADLPGLASDQLALLERAATVLKPGGRLVYATCSSEPEENEDVVDHVLAEGLLQPASRDRYPAHVRPFVNDASRFRTYPFRDGLEAFFGALLVRPA
jgi:16S rRNA (cytosine967-C5)-methyltransferase